MILFIDDKQFESKARSMPEAMEEAKKVLDSAGRVIVGVQFNDRNLMGEELVNQRDSDVIAGVLRIKSADPREMAISTLQVVRKAIRDIGQAQLDAARLIREGQMKPAMEILSEVFDVWRQSQEAILVSCEVVRFNLDEHLYEGRSVGLFIGHLVNEVEMLYGLLKRGDRMAAADKLSGEWMNFTKQFDAFLAQIVAWFEASNQPPSST